MARVGVMAALLAVLIVWAASPAAEAGRSSRRLNSGYSSPYSSSSPSTPSPYTSTPSTPSAPVITSPTPDISSTPSPYTTTPSISSPSTPDITSPTPDITSPTPATSSPSPLTATPSPSGGYGGYGSHSGCGTPKFWMDHPSGVPKILSLLSTLAKLFGPGVQKVIGLHKTLMGAMKDTSPDAMPSLAREGAASLINAYTYKDFPLSAMTVVSQFNNALSSPELAAQQALNFQHYNEAV